MNNGICHLKIKWHENIGDNTFSDPIVGKIVSDGNEKWSLLLKIRAFNQVKNKEVVLFFTNPVNPFHIQWSGEREKPTAWGMEKLGPGVWTLEPSLIIPNIFHAFITIINVPEPSPWSE